MPCIHGDTPLSTVFLKKADVLEELEAAVAVVHFGREREKERVREREVGLARMNVLARNCLLKTIGL